MDTSTIEHVGLLLAAGAGTRFGGAYPGAKLDQRVDGVAVGVRAFETLAQVVDTMIVVVRNDESTLARHAAMRGATVVVNPAPARGLGASLAIAAEYAITSHPDARFIWAYLADMPYLENDVKSILAPIKMSIASNSLNTIFQPVFAPRPSEVNALTDRAKAHVGKPGHPVVFGRAHWAALAALDGDQGARALIESQREYVMRIPVAHEGIWRDVDVPAHLSSASVPENRD